MMSANPLEPQRADIDANIPKRWDSYAAENHVPWDRRLPRQCALLPSKATPAFREDLDALRLSQPGIPHFNEANKRVTTLTESDAILPTHYVQAQGSRVDGRMRALV